MIEYPDWLQALHVKLDGETTGEHCARIVRALDGVSLVHDRAKLEALFLANESQERAALVASMQTNCGTSMRAIMALAGVLPEDHLITDPYAVGMAVSWVLQAASERGALIPGNVNQRSYIPCARWTELGPGWALHYGTPGHNDDHLEWCLAVPNAHGYAVHGGGGRSQNAITVEPSSDIRWSRGRPLQHVIDPAKMICNEATGDNPY